jgi:hypothetical protein
MHEIRDCGCIHCTDYTASASTDVGRSSLDFMEVQSRVLRLVTNPENLKRPARFTVVHEPKQGHDDFPVTLATRSELLNAPDGQSGILTDVRSDGD